MLKTDKTLARSGAIAVALAACIAAPSAFAQDAAKAAETQDAMTQQTSPPVASQAAAPAKKSWSELDANNNGSLSASEAAPMESLAKVFPEADANADGELTQDEYKTWLAANNSKKQPKQEG